MQPHLEIEFGHLCQDEAAQAAAREGLALLLRACPELAACHVTLAGPADGHHLCQPLCVQIQLRVCGTSLSVEQPQRAGEAPPATVRRAFDTAQRLLLDWPGAGARADRRRPPIAQAQAAPEHP
jgi:hypothetical protein